MNRTRTRERGEVKAAKGGGVIDGGGVLPGGPLAPLATATEAQPERAPVPLALDAGPTPGEARAWVRGYRAGREVAAIEAGRLADA